MEKKIQNKNVFKIQMFKNINIYNKISKIYQKSYSNIIKSRCRNSRG